MTDIQRTEDRDMGGMDPRDRRDLLLTLAGLAIAILTAVALKALFDGNPAWAADRASRTLAMLPTLPFLLSLGGWFRFTGRRDELFQTKDGIALRVAVLFSAGFATSTTLMQEVAGRDPLPMLWTVAVFVAGYAFGWFCAWQKFR